VVNAYIYSKYENVKGLFVNSETIPSTDKLPSLDSFPSLDNVLLEDKLSLNNHFAIIYDYISDNHTILIGVFLVLCLCISLYLNYLMYKLINNKIKE